MCRRAAIRCEEVRAHLEGMIEDGILASEERGRSDKLYKHLFQVNTSQHDSTTVIRLLVSCWMVDVATWIDPRKC